MPNLAGDLAGVGGGGFPPAYYSGHDATNNAWGSLTWSGLHNALTITDVDQVGITRSNSSWTFAAAGTYVLDIQSNYYRTVSAWLGFRARLAGATIGLSMVWFTEGASRATFAGLHKRLTLAAGDVVTLEYAVASAGLSVAAVTLDGEVLHTCNIEIYRIGGP